MAKSEVATERERERRFIVLRGGVNDSAVGNASFQTGTHRTMDSPPDAAASVGRGASPPGKVTVVRGRGAGGGRVRMIPCEVIECDPIRARREAEDPALPMLADSIHRHGILVPLTVRPRPEGYALIAGERRLRAARMLRMREVPCLVLPADDRLCAEFAVIESMQRRELDPFEQARVIGELIERTGLTREEAARQLSCSVSCVANKLRLLRLGEQEREVVRRHGLSERHARAVLRLADPALRASALRTVALERMSVAEAEEFVDRLARGDARVSNGSFQTSSLHTMGSPTGAAAPVGRGALPAGDPPPGAGAPVGRGPCPPPVSLRTTDLPSGAAAPVIRGDPPPPASRQVRDLRPVETSLLRAVETLRSAGVDARLARVDRDGRVEFTVVVPVG